MTLLTAQRSVVTYELGQIAKLGGGSGYSAYGGADVAGGTDFVDYFNENKVGAPHFYHTLHVRLIGAHGDLSTNNGAPGTMTVTAINVGNSGSSHAPPFPNSAYQISGLAIELT